jgi:YidC/Oxa1 family membrane protein insertase
MAKALIWLDSLLQRLNVDYHWGFAIIVFTLIIKVLTLPLTITQIRGMQAQKDLQPKIQELQKKYGKDREKLSQEQMKLYKEAGVNPLSGCLPLVVQMPILFGLYSALIALGPLLQDARFFWIPDLGFPEYTQGLSWIPENFQAGNYGLLAAYLVLPVSLVVTQFVMQKWMTPSTPDTGGGQAAGMTKQVGLMMTFMFGFFTLQVPAGLTLYWVTSNLLQMFQQWFITSGRLGLGSSGGTATSASSVAEIATSTQESGAATVASTSTNGSEPMTEENAPKRRRRRRAKRR